LLDCIFWTLSACGIFFCRLKMCNSLRRTRKRHFKKSGRKRLVADLPQDFAHLIGPSIEHDDELKNSFLLHFWTSRPRYSKIPHLSFLQLGHHPVLYLNGKMPS
jgi:hypothetical protein